MNITQLKRLLRALGVWQGTGDPGAVRHTTVGAEDELAPRLYVPPMKRRSHRYGPKDTTEVDEVPLPRSQAVLLEEILNGNDTVPRLAHTLGWTKTCTQSEVQKAVGKRLVEVDGWRGRLHVTGTAYDTLPLTPRRPTPKAPKRQKFDVSWLLSFKLIFGAILALFLGWLIVSAAAGLVYWASYTFLIKPYLATNRTLSRLLPYIPLSNPIVALGLGLASGAWLFLKFNLGSLFSSVAKRS